MNARTSDAHHQAIYSLWHIPTSTLLVETNVASEVERRIEMVTTHGIAMDELLLNVEQDGLLVGKQHMGSSMLVALHTPE